MKNFFLTAAFAIVILNQFAWSHGDHHEMNKIEASQNAITQVEKLVTDKKLTDSWKAASVLKTETATISGKKRWIVVLENNKETDNSKRKLEVVFTPGGKFISYQFSH